MSVQGIVTQTTCSFPCWYAHKPTCQCSCGGANHGILLVEGAEQPVRQRRVGEIFYHLEAIGSYSEMKHAVRAWNRSVGWREIHDYHTGPPENRITHRSHTAWGMWSENEKGIPAFMARATDKQLINWAELKPVQGTGYRFEAYLLWVRDKMPAGDFCFDECQKCDELMDEIRQWRKTL